MGMLMVAEGSSTWQRNKVKIVLAVIMIIIIVGSAYIFTLPKEEEEEPTTGITLKVISRHDTTIWDAFETAFLKTDYAKQYNITDIEWKGPDPGFWRSVIEAGDIDVAWGGGPTLFDELIRQVLLEPLTGSRVLTVVDGINDTIAGAPMKRLNADGEILWAAAAISSFGFTVNHAFLRDFDLPVPQKWEDLASITYAKTLPGTASISMGNAPNTTSNTRIYIIILQAFGWEEGWSTLTRMAANARIYKGSGISVDVQSAVETGVVGISMSIDFYGYTSQLVNPECEYIIPEGESIINGDPIALVKDTEHKEAAEAFIAWILSSEGQSLWLKREINRMPIGREAFDTPAGQERTDLQTVYEKTVRNIGIEFNDTMALSYTDSMMLYFQSVLTDVHTELVEAWTALVEARNEGSITEDRFQELAQNLGQPVKWVEDGETVQFTLEYAQSINDRIRDEPAFANEMATKWRDAAKAQYASIKAEV